MKSVIHFTNGNIYNFNSNFLVENLILPAVLYSYETWFIA